MSMIQEIIERHEKMEPDREKRRLMIPALKIATILNEESGSKVRMLAIVDTALKCLSPRFSLEDLHLEHTSKDENKTDESS